MTPFDPAVIRSLHDERRQRLGHTRRWAEGRPTHPDVRGRRGHDHA